MRKRNREWKTRLTEEEYQKLMAVATKFGMTKQEYGERALMRRIMLNDEQYELLQELLPAVQDLVLQLRRTGTNLNQLARVANTNGALPTLEELQEIQVEIHKYGEEANAIWQFLKRLQNRRQVQKG